METWFIVLITLCISALLKSIINLLSLSTTTKNLTKAASLPPGSPTVPILSSLLWLRKSFLELEPILRDLHARYGPMVTLRIGSHPAIFVSDRSIAHHALIQNGVVFADRPPPLPTNKILSSNQHNISLASYGPTWRSLRRNLTSEILHPSRVKSYSPARKWALEILIHRFENQSTIGEPVRVVDHFQYAMFSLLVFMCFGDKFSENQLRDIQNVQRRLLLNLNRYNILNFWPKLTRILLRKRWEEFLEIIKSQEKVFIPFIRARKQLKKAKLSKAKEDGKEDIGDGDEDQSVLSYVDTLLDLQLPDEKRKLDEGEIVSLCSEFFTAGTDTTSTTLQWIMANVVKYPHIQEKLVEEINGVVGPEAEEVKEEDLQKMPYLKAVILEGLRRHPPGHFLVPHSVTEDATLNGYLVPKNGTINFMVAEMGWDPKVWENPMEFKPERFLSGGGGGDNGSGEMFDITGSREIKMMPFGVGRRICPGHGLAMLLLEYFVANLVWYFKWTAVDGDEVDLSEKQEFTMVMKNPLRAHLSPRQKCAVY